MLKTHRFTDRQLDRFRELQRLSFSILQAEARALEPGMIERDVAHRLVQAYRREGVKSFFHLPVVPFGERTALPGDEPPHVKQWRLIEQQRDYGPRALAA